MVEIALDIF